MKISEILKRAAACIDRLPDRTISTKTFEGYSRAFDRMWREKILDPLRPGIARDTYLHRRAALHFMSRYWLTHYSNLCVQAAERNDIRAVQHWAGELLRALDRVEPALVLEPPLDADVSRFEAPRSRWHEIADGAPPRGGGSKKHVLRQLPPDWLARLWEATPPDWPYRMALAVHMLTPVRPEEFLPGPRAHAWSEGVIVMLNKGALEIMIPPAKSHGGRFGTSETTILIDPKTAGGPAAYLAELCAASGGRLVVSLCSTSPMRKALARFARRALPEVRAKITPYVFRHQVIADLKATLGAGAEVAAAAGHCTDRTQARYGRVQHGRKRGGIVGVRSRRAPRAENVARAHALAGKRRHAVNPRKNDVSGPDE